MYLEFGVDGNVVALGEMRKVPLLSRMLDLPSLPSLSTTTPKTSTSPVAWFDGRHIVAM